MTDTSIDTRDLMAPEKLQAAVVTSVKLAIPQLLPHGRNLVYILSQSERIGHFGMETQIVRTLYEDRYDRIVIVTGVPERPGTNRWIPSCAGPKIRFVHTDDFDVAILGQVDAGVRQQERMDMLFAGPRTLFKMFYRHILEGRFVKRLELPEVVEHRARQIMRGHGVDPDEPFVLFHNRTLAYRPEMSHHGHRTAEITSYRPSICRLIEAGYRVIRLGEQGLDTMDLDGYRYVNVPDWQDNDGAVDLYVLARCAFGLAQNSGPIWVAAAFGRPVLRTNTPFEHLNLPYNDDISLFKRYRRTGSAGWLDYREILDLSAPALFLDEDIRAAGIELVGNSEEELLAATEEMLSRVGGTWRIDAEQQLKFRDLGRAYEQRVAADPRMARHAMDFYGYAHPFGYISQSFLADNPAFLD